MKLGTAHHFGADCVVTPLPDGRMVDLAAAAREAGADPAPFHDMPALLTAWGKRGKAVLNAAATLAEDPAEEAILPAGTRLRAPLPRPEQMRDCLVFEEHLVNCFKVIEQATGRKHEVPPVWYAQPIYYKANRFSVIGPEEDVIWPDYSEHMDLELELAAVIGKGGRDIRAEDAAAHIFGYTIFNDVTARDAQMAEMAGQLGPAKGKDFDTGNVLGPWIVTADEFSDPLALDMEVRVNGERWGGGNSRDMHHSFGAILAHVSRSETLHCGEVIGSGTVGTGCGLEIGRRLAPGDVMELEVAGIGVLRNRIVRP